MAIIKKLDQKTTNLIAAGEVIERPASVIKELVENAIDAGSKNIVITLVDSGIKEMSVSDNGVGMDLIDAKLAIEPHATSNIKDGNDLFRINSLGFRGEALPSIASISHFRMKTSNDGVRGIMYNLKGGALVSEAIVASSRGTEIKVRNLFYNTPARLQSLQAPAAELSYITDFVSKIALANPEISFTLSNNDKVVLSTHGSNDLLEVIFSVYGTDVAKSMISLFNDDGFFKIEGFISKINQTRSSRSNINIIVNGRVIRNNNLVNAVIRGYGERLMHGRYPLAVINISVDAGLVDVNVHPAKLEVRFSNEEDLLNLLTTAVRYALKSTDLTIDLSTNETEDKNNLNNIDELEDLYKDLDKVENNELNDFDIKMFEIDDIPLEENNKENYVNISSKEVRNEPDSKFISSLEKDKFQQQTYSFVENEILNDEEERYKLPKMDFLGQLFGTYVLAQGNDDFFLIDQHAAAERVNYEKILIELKKPSVNTYELLIPFKLDYTISEAILINEHLDAINNLGIDIEDFGGGTFTVRSLPVWIPRGREIDYTDEIITSLVNNKRKEKYEFQTNLAKDLACKKSIKGNEFHTQTEIEYLLEDLSKANNPFTCPHGRPVIVKFSKYEIEKWFKRIV